MIGRNNSGFGKRRMRYANTGQILPISRRLYSKSELKLSIFETLFSKYSPELSIAATFY
jgi:hypothetical protein